MIRSVLAVVLCVMVLGMSCQVPAALTALTCGNNLNGTKFGFTLTVPSEFECVDPGLLSLVGLEDFILAFVAYMDSSTNASVVIVVSEPAAGGEGQASAEGVSAGQVETLDPETVNGIEFALFKSTATDSTRVSYSAAAQTSGGAYILLIAIQAESDDASLLETLRTMMQSVSLT